MASSSPSADSIAVVDLRLLSQSDLYALSLSSSSSADLRRCDSAVVPKIDRSVFNESVGSRKQTYSRLRLAPRKPQLPSAAATASSSSSSRRPRGRPPRHLPPPSDRSSPDLDGDENKKIIACLQRLFVAAGGEEDHWSRSDDLVPVPIEYGESVPEVMVADIVRGSVQEVPIDVVGNLKKRKRGRKPRIQNPEMDSGAEAGSAKASEYGGVDGPYSLELRRRTEGLDTQADLIGFLDKVSGKWGSARKKRKTVDASEFGDSLPKGWKLLLRLTRRANRVWPICSGYISPNGHRFASYKEVSSYLCSMRLEDAGKPNSDKLILLDHKVTNTNADKDTLNNDNDGACNDCCLTSPSVAASCENQLISLKTISPQIVPLGHVMNGGKCSVGFEKNNVLHHPLSSLDGSMNLGKLDLSISKGPQIRDIEHESQISHKLCLQGSPFEGLVKVHVNIDKTIEPSPEVTTIEERIETTPLGEASPEVSNIQALVGINRDPVPQSFDSKDGNKLASIFFRKQPDSDTVRETCIDKRSHQDEEQTEAKNNGNCLVEEIHEKQDRDKVGSNSTDEKGSEATDIGFAEPNFHLGAKDVPIYYRNKGDDQDSLKCTHEVSKAYDDHRISDSYIAGEEDKTGTRYCPSDGSPVNQYKGDVIGQFKDKHSSLKSHEPEIDHGGKLGDKEEVKRQISPERCSGVQNEQERLVDCMNGDLISTIAESNQEEGSKGGLSISSSDEQACVVDDSVNAISTWTLDFQKPKVVNSQTTVDFGSTCGRPDDDAVTNFDLRIISESSLVSSCNEEASVEKVSTCMAMFPPQEKGGESCSFAPFDSLENHANKISVGTMEDPKLGEEGKCSSELFVDFGGFYSRHDASAVTSAEEETRIGFFSIAPSGSPGFSLGIDVNGISYGSFVDPIQNPSDSELMNDVGSNLNHVAASSLGKKTLHETNSCWNNELTISLGSNQTGLDMDDATNEQNKTFENCFLHSEAEQIFGDRSSVNGVPCSTLEEHGQERSIEHNTFSLSCSKQTSDSEINLKKANTVLTREVGLGKFEHPENNRIAPGLGRNIAQSDLWRTFEETSLQDGLALPKFPLLQSSNCFPAFNLLSNKAEGELFTADPKLDSISGFVGPRSSSGEHLEHDFLTVQTNSQSHGSTVSAYGVPMGQGFDTSCWFGAEVSFPSVPGRHQVRNMCVWCGNEFLGEAVDPGIHTGSVGLICPTCKAKF